MAARSRVGTAKTTIPSANDSTLTRRRLEERLDVALDRSGDAPLVLVTAPAGFGKTTLLAGWARQVVDSGRPVAWCVLDENDATAFRFWSAVLDAVERASPADAWALADVAAPREPGDADFLTALSEEVAALGVVLVLENVHALTDPAVVRDLDQMLARRAGAVVLSSRWPPALSALQVAKLEGRLDEITTAHLAFDEPEVAQVCAGLAPAELDTVWQRSEGWPAMVRLVDLAMRSESPSEAGPTTYDGELADYVFHDAFRGQDDRVRHVLLTASVPDVVSDTLAVLVSEDQHAGWVLEDVSRLSGLITPTRDLDGSTTYRLHPLLRSHLRQQLHRGEPGLEQAVQRRVAARMLEHDHHLDAVRHAAAVVDPGFLDDVVRGAGPALVNSGEARLLLDALGQPAVGAASIGPWTRVVRAAALLDLDRLSQASAQLQGGAPPSDGSAPELVAVWEAITGHLRRRQGITVDRDDVLGPVPDLDGDLRLLLAVHRGATLIRLGLLDQAEAELDLGVVLAEGLGRSAAMVDCLTFRAAANAARNLQEPLARHADAALALGESRGWGSSPRMAQTHLFRAWSHYQSLQDGLAQVHVGRALALLAPGAEPTVRVGVHSLYAALAQRMGTPRDPRVPALHTVVVESVSREVGPATLVLTAFMDVHLSRASGHLHHLPEILETLRARLGERGELVVVEAMIRESEGCLGEARALLDRPVRDAHVQVPITMVEHLALAARLARLDGDATQATVLAGEALATAERFGVLRPLTDAGAELADVLREGMGTWGQMDDVARQVLDYDGTPETPHADLTSRELQILQQLESLSTVEDIAADLYVSVNTVKTHVRAIYRKLDVGSRRDAVARARRMGLV